MRFFHATTQKSANAILREGFRDGEGSYMFSPEDLEEAFGRPTLSGVFVASGPTSSQDGAAGDVVLELELSDEFDVTPWAIEEEGLEVWEWLIPASFLNEHAQVRLYAGDEYWSEPSSGELP